MMEEVEVRLRFEEKSIRLGDEVIDEEREWKPESENLLAENNGI